MTSGYAARRNSYISMSQYINVLTLNGIIVVSANE